MPFNLLLIAAVAATQGVQGAPAVPSPAAGEAEHPFRAGLAFMSPMGEPFFGRTQGQDGLAVWFEQADRNHDGSITLDEMAADAQRFFDLLDTNHDGEIDPDEIAHYEQVIAPEVRRGPMLATAETTQSQDVGSRGDHQGGYHGAGRGGGRGHHRGGAGGGDFGAGFGGDDEASAGRFGLLAIPEPVASADADLNRGVSSEEFRKAATERFSLLDMKHSGRLTLPELQGIRQSSLAAARRPPRQSSSVPEGPPAIADDGSMPPM
jgi:Ca2+-binding EF-hand superfamily protein